MSFPHSFSAFRFPLSAFPKSALPLEFRQTCRRLGIPLSRFVLLVDTTRQRMSLAACMAPFSSALRTPRCAFSRVASSFSAFRFPLSAFSRPFRISTSRFGAGEVANTNRTPRGLHRVAKKVGGGWPVGSVFRSRQFIGYTWDGMPGAPITNRIFWLEGLEPGCNKGGTVDTFARYIYIHGTGDEPTLGRPASCGCLHLAAADLIPLYDSLPVGTLVWIA